MDKKQQALCDSLKSASKEQLEWLYKTIDDREGMKSIKVLLSKHIQ